MIVIYYSSLGHCVIFKWKTIDASPNIPALFICLQHSRSLIYSKSVNKSDPQKLIASQFAILQFNLAVCLASVTQSTNPVQIHHQGKADSSHLSHWGWHLVDSDRKEHELLPHHSSFAWYKHFYHHHHYHWKIPWTMERSRCLAVAPCSCSCCCIHILHASALRAVHIRVTHSKDKWRHGC